MHTFVHTYIHTYIYTHTHTHERWKEENYYTYPVFFINVSKLISPILPVHF
jgi:hypothetical protein